MLKLLVRSIPAGVGHRGFAPGSQQQNLVLRELGVQPNVFDAALVMVAQLIKPQTVGGGVGAEFHHIAMSRKPQPPAVDTHPAHHQQVATLFGKGGYNSAEGADVKEIAAQPIADFCVEEEMGRSNATSFLRIATGLWRDYLFFLRCSQQKRGSSRQALIGALKGWSESRAHSESKQFAECGEDLQQSSERGHYPRASRAAAVNTNKIPPCPISIIWYY